MKWIVNIMVRILAYTAIIAVTAGITILVFFARLNANINAPLKTEWNEQSGTILKDLTYGNGKHNHYDLYLPAYKDTHSVMLFLHGGSFTSGDKADEDLWCKYFAARGYITATANYSLKEKDSDSNLNLMCNELLRCVEDIKNQCEVHGYMVDGLAMSGQSAGGCLALLYAYRMGNDSAIPVKFVFQQTGGVSYDPALWGATDDVGKAGITAGLTGRSVTESDVQSGKYMDYVKEISPVYWVNEHTVPTLSAYGPRDKIVPPALKFKLFEQFEKYGVPYDYIEYPHSGHALADDVDKQKEFVKKTLEYAAKYF